MTAENEMPIPAALLVNVAQATSMLSISRSTLYQLIGMGQLKPVYIGRCVRFDPDELRRFAQQAAKA